MQSVRYSDVYNNVLRHQYIATRPDAGIVDFFTAIPNYSLELQQSQIADDPRAQDRPCGLLHPQTQDGVSAGDFLRMTRACPRANPMPNWCHSEPDFDSISRTASTVLSRVPGIPGPAPPALIGCPGTRCHLPRSLPPAIIPVAPLTRTRL